MTVKPTSFVLEHAPWSFSKAGVAQQCPYRFKLQYIDKKRMGLAPNEAALTGMTVHSILEYTIAGMQLSKAIKIAIEQHDLTTDEIELVKALVPTIKNFMSKFATYCKRHSAAIPCVEQKLGIDIEGRTVRFWDNKKAFFRGAIDVYCMFKKKPIAVMLDHKTGKAYEIDHFEQQFNGYLLLLRAKETYLEKIQIGINFLKEDRIEFKKGLQDVRDIQPIFEKLVTFLNDSTVDTHNFTVVKPGPLCNWCDYQSICPTQADTHNGNQKESR